MTAVASFGLEAPLQVLRGFGKCFGLDEAMEWIVVRAVVCGMEYDLLDRAVVDLF